MKLLEKSTYKIILLTSSFLIFIIGIAIFISTYDATPNYGCGTVTPVLLCGNKSLTDGGQKGKQFFNSNCSACHKLDKEMTGPALRGIVDDNKFPYKNYLFDFITREDSLNKVNDTYSKLINEEYRMNFSHEYKLTEIEFNNLVEYLK